MSKLYCNRSRRSLDEHEIVVRATGTSALPKRTAGSITTTGFPRTFITPEIACGLPGSGLTATALMISTTLLAGSPKVSPLTRTVTTCMHSHRFGECIETGLKSV